MKISSAWKGRRSHPLVCSLQRGNQCLKTAYLALSTSTLKTVSTADHYEDRSKLRWLLYFHDGWTGYAFYSSCTVQEEKVCTRSCVVLNLSLLFQKHMVRLAVQSEKLCHNLKEKVKVGKEAFSSLSSIRCWVLIRKSRERPCTSLHFKKVQTC